MARFGGLGHWLQRDHPPSTVVRWVQSWSRRILGVGVVWDWAPVGRQAGLLWCAWAGHAEGIMQEQLCSSAERTKEQGKNVSKTFTQQKMLRGGPRYRSRRQVEQRGSQPHPHDGRRQSPIRPFTPHSLTACGQQVASQLGRGRLGLDLHLPYQAKKAVCAWRFPSQTGLYPWTFMQLTIGARHPTIGSWSEDVGTPTKNC